METKRFELFAGCLGNGITICNKAVEEHGDYKMVAHISDKGNITWYVPESYCPSLDKERIRIFADNQRKAFMKSWNSYAPIRKYCIMLDELPARIWLPYVKIRQTNMSKSLCECVEDLEKEYFRL